MHGIYKKVCDENKYKMIRENAEYCHLIVCQYYHCIAIRGILRAMHLMDIKSDMWISADK